MLTGEIRNQIDGIWNDFWSGGLANPLQVIEQLTYLIFLKRLDEMQALEEKKAQRLGTPVSRRIFVDADGEPVDHLRWKNWKHEEPREMYALVESAVFPWLREMGGREGSYARHMKDARFQIPTPALLAKVVDKIDGLKMDDRDTKGDVYEYMLGKIASAGQNGQFRTPRHVIALMVELMEPKPGERICDPAAGTCGFLVEASEYLRRVHPTLFQDDRLRLHFNTDAFTGFDFDPTMLRIGSMNMMLHGIEGATVEARDSLAQEAGGEADRYDLILANPPFAGALDYETTAKDLLSIVRTKKTELLFLALFLRLLKVGGRAAVIVPEGVLFGSSTAHKEIRRVLVEEHKLDAVIKLPSGTFRPYAGVSTAILIFTKTGVGGTDHVWFYDVRADGWSLDDKRAPLMPEEKLGPRAELTEPEHEKNNLPDVVARFEERDDAERERARTEQSFCVPVDEIAGTGTWDLSLNRYREVAHEVVEHASPAEIMRELRALEEEIAAGMARLEGMVG